MAAEGCDWVVRVITLVVVAHFQKEWQTEARMSARSIMESFEGTIARAKSFADVSNVQFSALA